MEKKPKKLKLSDTNSIANLFADDLVKYFRMGGDMQYVNAKKVYAKLRNTGELVYDHGDLLDVLERRMEFLQDFPYMDDGQVSRETVDIIFNIDVTPDDQNFIFEKLNLDPESEWTIEQIYEYYNEVLKLNGIREEDRQNYFKYLYHNTEEEVNIDELPEKDESDSGAEE